ncbi:hypothetical protein BDY17DRAFT_328413 [Neohortaea acidophila]|uniref:intramembrane prenyl-peptidase Rce1 n=1 Tax=Neohortaea acidophila TaxID=245834 RepID=A0A6A6PGP9_9PEZI|nr:uncharacterized protein BDY17DRAFT_328413 [Neohortaea acidophila]KAF2478904.1 hypothetical protein BDY17DRAFT_328413 [Neohortaea acidophila]
MVGNIWPREFTWFDRLRTLPLPDAGPMPAISERTAFLCAAAYTIFYVAPFYLSATLRTSAANSRNTPVVIKARVRAVTLTCLTCLVVTAAVLVARGHYNVPQILRACGVWPVHPLDLFKVLLLVIVLFTCSLYESIVVDGDWRGWSLVAFKQGIWDDWVGFRNLVVAPASEELVFRALVIPLFQLAQTGVTRIVFVTPLIFGVAHVHHLVEFIQSRTPPNRRIPPLALCLQGVVISLFQFAYTSIFGWFAAFVFLRTGNIWAAIVAHSFCNHMGVPRLWGRLGQSGYKTLPPQSVTPDVAESMNSAMQGEQSLPIAWTVAYYVLMVVGAYAFSLLLSPLTESKYALVRF